MNQVMDTVVRLVAEEPPTQEFRLQDADSLMAKELNQLSRQEREQILYEVHGITEKHEGSPEFLTQRLNELQRALDEQLHSKQAYNLGLAINADYVTNRSFRLMFLRADQYNSYNAALRLVRFMESKLELFGRDLLCKDITQDDLDEGSLNCLYAGWIQELPVRDIAGRVVSILLPREMNCTVEQKLRRMFYATMVLVEDEETQTNGRVFIIWMSKQKMDRSATWKIGRLVSALPSRYAAVHICLNDKKMHGPLVALARFAVETLVRVRLRTHVGSPIELKYILQTFGIPAQNLPITNDGEILRDGQNQKWTQRREEERRRRLRQEIAITTAMEMEMDMMDMMPIDEGTPDIMPALTHGYTFCPEPIRITTPSNTDVLLGRGRLSQEHLGNIRFRYLIDEHQNCYDEAMKKKKTAMAADLVRLVQSRNGRFLKEDGSGWVEVDDAIARTKASTCFRTSRHRRKKEYSR